MASHSKLGVASIVFAAFAAVTLGAMLIWLALLARLLATRSMPLDAPGLGVMALLLVAAALLSNLSALGLGVTGILQRRRKRLFAFAGVAVSAAVFLAVSAQDVLCLPIDCVPFT